MKLKSKFPFDPKREILDRLPLTGLIILIGTVAVLIIVWIMHKPYYSSTATLIFEKDLPEILYTDRERFVHSFEDWMRTQVHEVESNTVLDTAINRYENKGFKWTLPGESKKTAIDRLRIKLEVSQINNTQIMELTMTLTDKNGLSELINEVIKSYVDFKEYQRTSLDQQKLEYLEKEKQEYENKLNDHYNELMKISKQYGTAVADEKNLYIYLNMFMDLRSKYNDVLLQKIESENEYTSLSNKKNQIDTTNIRDQQTNTILQDADQELVKKMVGLNPQSEEFRKLKNLREDLRGKDAEVTRQRLVSFLNLDLINAKTKYAAATNSQTQLKIELNKVQEEVMQFNTAVLRASTKRQEIERTIELWNKINDRIEQIRIELFNPGSVRILNPAIQPDFPDASQPIKKISVGILGSMIFALSIALFLGYRDERIKRASDINTYFGFPVTGQIIKSEEENITLDTATNLFAEYPNSFLAGQITECVARIEREYFKNGSKIFGFSGLSHRAGTTLITMNLLHQIEGQTNKKILISFENRKSQLTEIQVSEIELKLGTPNIKLVITQNESFHFHTVNVYDIIHSLPSSEQTSLVKLLVSNLSENYDLIFLDFKPMMVGNQLFHRMVQSIDSFITIVNSEKDEWPQLIRTINLLDKIGVPSVGIIMNRIQTFKNGYYKRLMTEHQQTKSESLLD